MNFNKGIFIIPFLIYLVYNSNAEVFVKEIKVYIREDEEYITLQSLLKIEDIIPSGGMAKIYLMESPVLVNGELENRRGRKLYSGDKVVIEKVTYLILK